MKVFISWSGALGESLGNSIRNWLPNVIQSVSPYFTPLDTDKGVRWESEIASELQDSTIGILCITRESLNSSWLLFEAGALSKQLNQSRVCPILFGIKPTDLSGPLRQFQATEFTREDFGLLIAQINDCLGNDKLAEKTLQQVFNKWWPDLEKELSQIMGEQPTQKKPVRKQTEILDEILTLVRKVDSSSRPINARAVKDLLEGYITLHDQQASCTGGYQDALDLLQKMHAPTKHIALRTAARSPEVRELIQRLKQLSYLSQDEEDADESDDSIDINDETQVVT